MECEHDKISYIGQIVDERSKEYLPEEDYRHYEHLDLYNCVECRTTLAIDRRKVGELEKEIISL